MMKRDREPNSILRDISTVTFGTAGAIMGGWDVNISSGLVKQWDICYRARRILIDYLKACLNNYHNN